MSRESRWLRLNVDWSKSDWLIVLSAESRLAWIELLCYCKVYGNGRGSCPKRSPLSLSRIFYMGEESVSQMLMAAKAEGALAEDGENWTLTAWSEYQSPGTERQRKFRSENVTLSDAQSRSPVTVPVPVTKKKEEKNVIPPKREWVMKRMRERKWHDPERSATEFMAHYDARDWISGKTKFKNWHSCMTTWECREDRTKGEGGQKFDKV